MRLQSALTPDLAQAKKAAMGAARAKPAG